MDTEGSWVLPNVPAGIGQVRLRATCVEDGVTIGGQSDYFTVPADGVIRVDEIHFDGQAPVPERLTLSASTTTLTEPGQVLPLTVVALYPDGTSADVTSAAAGTNYVVSNPAVATLSPDGELTAVASGTVIVSALNEGASGFLRLQVVLSGDSDGDGIPDDVEVALGLDPNDPVDALLDPDDDGLTNGDEVAYGSDPNDPDTDGDGLEDGEEVSITGTSPALFDTDGDGLSDGLEIATGSDPLDPGSYNLAEALASFEIRPGSFVLNSNTVFLGEAFVELQAAGTLIDGTTIDLTSSSRGTVFSSSDLLLCNFGAEDGVVFAGAEGICTITATNSGFTALAEGLVQEFSPAPLKALELPSFGNSLAVQDDWVFVAGAGGGLHVIDVSDRLEPRLVTTLPLAGNANDIAVEGGLAYVTVGGNGFAGLHVIDVSVPATPVLLGTVETPGPAIALRVVADLVYIADGSDGLQVVSVADPTLPSVIGSWPTLGTANGLAVDGGLAVVSTKDSPLEVIDVSTPTAPVGVSTLPLPVRTFDVELIGPYAYVATSNDLRVVDLSDPSVPVDVGAFGAGLWMIDLLAVGEDRIFTTQVRPDTPMPMFDLRFDPAAPSFAGVIPFGDLGAGFGDGVHLAADDHHVYMTATTGYEVDDKPQTSGSSRLLIGIHQPLSESEGELEPPEATIILPVDGAEVVEGQPFIATVLATDNVGVLDVELVVDGVPYARDNTPPYSFSVDSPPAPSTLQIGAIARDFAGQLGEAAEITVHVVAGAGVTTVVGVVQDENGAPVAGASVTTSLGGQDVTAADGSFSIEGLPATAPNVVAFAGATIDGTQFRGRSASTAVVSGGVTDVGAISLAVLGQPYPGPRSSVASIANRSSSATQLQAMASGDFDGDGVPDAVVAAETFCCLANPQDTFAFLPGRGDGSFGEFSSFSNGLAPDISESVTARDIEVADLNLDGSLDLITVDSENEVRVSLGQGDGSFLDPVVLAPPIVAHDVAVGDVDRDTLLDLVVSGAQSFDAELSIYLGLGDGTFAPPSPVTLPSAAGATRIGDLDGDGNMDLVTLQRLAVLFGNGDGTFQAPVELQTGTRPVFEHELGDVDGNGLPDVLALRERPYPATGDHLAVFLSQGDGTFLELEGSAAVPVPSSMELADLDLDGVLDVLVIGHPTAASTLAYALLGDGTGLFTALPGTQMGALDRFWDPFVLTDFDLDGAPDLASAGYRGVSVFSGNGDGTFHTYLRGDTSFSLPVDVGSDIAMDDLDGDGLDDLVRGNDSGVGYFLRLPDGQFGQEIQLPLSYNLRKILTTDLNRDGAADIVTIGTSGSGTGWVSAHYNAGDGTFADPPEERTESLGLEDVVAADLTGNGLPDLVLGSSYPSYVAVMPNNGGLDPAQLTPMPRAIERVAVGDFDQDGDLDVVASDDSVNLHILTNDGSGALTLTRSIRLDLDGTGDPRRPNELYATDLNGDGMIDLLTTQSGGTREDGSVAVLLGQAGGEFGQETRFPVGISPQAVAIGDVDFDGIVDLVVVNANNHDLSVLTGVGDGTFLPEKRFATDLTPETVLLVEMSGDGVHDLVVGTRLSVGGNLCVLIRQ